SPAAASSPASASCAGGSCAGAGIAARKRLKSSVATNEVRRRRARARASSGNSSEYGMPSTGRCALRAGEVPGLDPERRAALAARRLECGARRHSQPRLIAEFLARLTKRSFEHERLEAAVIGELDVGVRRPVLEPHALARVLV